jgi:L-aspartate oxidase
MERIQTDVLVIGAGAAGIRAAAAAREAGAEVFVMTRGGVTGSGSTFSPVTKGWGIQALIGRERTPENLEAFYDDVIRVGLGICDPKLVRILVEQSGPRLEDLVSYGLGFRKDPEGHYVRVTGCFSDSKRAFLTEDFDNVKTSLLSVLKRSASRILAAEATSLIINEGSCWGVRSVTPSGEVLSVDARATVLATGGGAGLFKHSMVHDGGWGTGHAMAARAGAELTNMEFIQFMLGLRSGDGPAFLPLSDLGRPCALKNEKGEDLLEEWISMPAQRLDVLENRSKHFPFSSHDGSFGIDLAIARENLDGRRVLYQPEPNGGDPAEVLHHAHAFNGGVKIDSHGATGILGLYAAGEVAAGPHGADRIGGCMMTATQVFGKIAGQSAAGFARKRRHGRFPETKARDRNPGAGSVERGRGGPVAEVLLHVQDTLDRYGSIFRCEEGLKEGLERLKDCESRLEEIGTGKTVGPLEYVSLRNVVATGNMVMRSALDRKESRGCHYREDFPPAVG